MDRKMRRFKQLLSEEDSKSILTAGTNGILSLIDTDGEPYGIPISFAFDGESRIYFHSSAKGKKIECIESNPRCSFCVIGQDHIVPEEFTSYFRSVIVTGNLKKVTSTDEKLKGLTLLAKKYAPEENPDKEIS